jgi:hypothetical protein
MTGMGVSVFRRVSVFEDMEPEVARQVGEIMD